MICGKTVLAVIPARGGSKGVPGKNVRQVAGKPLIAWTIEEARKSRYVDRMILSSDDAGIIEVARKWGCEVPFVRPAELAQDDTPGIQPVFHAVRELPGYDYVVLLQPTSPLRTCDDIDRCIELCLFKGAFSCVSVVEPDKSPYWMFTGDSDGKIHPLLSDSQMIVRRQDLPQVYALNGAVYVSECETLLERGSFITDNTVFHLMAKHASIDIDTEIDLIISEILLEKSKNNLEQPGGTEARLGNP